MVSPWVVACLEELEAYLGVVVMRIQVVDPLAAESCLLLVLGLQVQEVGPLEPRLIFRLVRPFLLVNFLEPCLHPLSLALG